MYSCGVTIASRILYLILFSDKLLVHHGSPSALRIPDCMLESGILSSTDST